MRKNLQLVCLSLAAALFAGAAGADLKIGYIDPLSGGAASAGVNSQKHVQFYVDKINAAGGLNGEKLELLSYDNKVNPQESLIMLKKAIDEGARIIFQGNGGNSKAGTASSPWHPTQAPGSRVVMNVPFTYRLTYRVVEFETDTLIDSGGTMPRG